MLWNSVALSENQELEMGVNYLMGNVSATSDDDKQQLWGLDLTFAQALDLDQQLKLQAEYYEAKYGEAGEPRNRQSGGYVSGVYKLSPYYQAGLRFGILSPHGDEGSQKNQWTFMLTRQLTETSKFRLQYNMGDGVEDTIYMQFIFGMGPHSHVLQ